MSLGEAFVEVHADLRPFGQDLKQGVKPIVEAFEKQLSGAVGRAVVSSADSSGSKAGEVLGRSIKRSLLSQISSGNAFVAIANALGSTLGRGLSALPIEVKAAIVAGILAAAPLVAGALAAAVAAGLGVALVGAGIALASQFEQVQTRANEFGLNLRKQLVESARDFVPAIFNAFDLIETRVRQLRPALDRIFNVSSNFLEPLVEGGLDFIEQIIDSVGNSLNDIKPFVDELGSALNELGDATGMALEILVATGEDGRAAFRDLVAVVGAAVVAIAGLVFILSKTYGLIRNILKAASELLGPTAFFLKMVVDILDEIDRRANVNKSFVNTNTEATDSFDDLIAATKGETDALKDYRKALDDASEAVKNTLELHIDWEESLDNITESIDENGRTLDINTDKGRANARAFLESLEIAEKRAVDFVRRGELSAEQAVAQFDAQSAALRRMAIQAGLSEREFSALFDEIINTAKLRISSQEMGVDALGGELGSANSAAEELYATLQLIMNLRRNIGAGAVAGVRGFAEGGIHYMPEVVRVAEDGPEVTIPLTKPARAAALMAQSGLSSMLATNATNVLVYIGNEQLDARMVRIVQRGNESMAQALMQGPRRF